MNILDLVEEIGLYPKKAASTNGGEYKSKCPKCQDGEDRFCVWPDQGSNGRYWCRVCGCKGDGIQFCRDFLGMTYQQACQKMNVEPNNRLIIRNYFRGNAFIPKDSTPVSSIWKNRAQKFLEFSHKQLLHTPSKLKELFKRGLSIEAIKKFYLGWNSSDLFDAKSKWLDEPIINSNKDLKTQWLPKGIVIPSFDAEKALIKLKIRRADWHEKDSLPKYAEISGSKSCPSVYGDISKPIIIVESELDAILIQQYAAHLVCSIALGGVSKRPNKDLHSQLTQAPLILLSLDYDDSGKKGCSFWMKNYPNLRVWPAPLSKSIGDAVRDFQIDVIQWVKYGLSNKHQLN